MIVTYPRSIPAPQNMENAYQRVLDPNWEL